MLCCGVLHDLMHLYDMGPRDPYDLFIFKLLCIPFDLCIATEQYRSITRITDRATVYLQYEVLDSKSVPFS